jgi:transcriptional regulator of arginine metabolism
MVTKKSRQGRILEIVRRKAISSQDRLSGLLKSQGVDVTQSTLSRDIRELGLVKVRGVYQSGADARSTPAPELLRRALQQLVVQSGASGNIVMVKTAPGNGHSLGVVLDSAQWPEVLGTVAGDDTVFVLLRNARLGRKVLKRIEDCLS